MSTAPAYPDTSTYPYERTPLGLPAGSIRALLALGIAGAFWLNLSHPKLTHVPLYLHFLAFAVLLFFASHGRSLGRPNERSPWHLPRGTFRFLLIAGTIGIIVWQCLEDPHEMMKRMRPLESELDYWTSLFAGTLGGFFLGWLLSRGPWRNTAVYQDLVAWVAVISLILLLGEVLWKVFIDPTVKIGQREIWETILVSIVSFYFGSRS
jgi:hypothetical protein